MSGEDLQYKEMKLRECFKKKLEELDVDGTNDYMAVKCIKTYGVLWHVTHQLLMAEGIPSVAQMDAQGKADTGNVTRADTMNIQATGLHMKTGGK